MYRRGWKNEAATSEIVVGSEKAGNLDSAWVRDEKKDYMETVNVEEDRDGYSVNNEDV